MNKVNVIGTGGSGKSIFAKRLAKKLACEYIELDTIHWSDNWTEVSDKEFREGLSKRLEKKLCWVVDGNYYKIRDVLWSDIDTVIWLNYSFPLVLWRVVKRSVMRVVFRDKLWGTNNVEKISRLLSKDSMILWTIRTHYKKRLAYKELMAAPAYKHINFIEIKSPQKAQEFLNSL